MDQIPDFSKEALRELDKAGLSNLIKILADNFYDCYKEEISNTFILPSYLKVPDRFKSELYMLYAYTFVHHCSLSEVNRKFYGFLKSCDNPDVPKFLMYLDAVNCELKRKIDRENSKRVQAERKARKAAMSEADRNKRRRSKKRKK